MVKLRQFSADLRDWYFERGGMYLSRSAREAYGKVQEALSSVVAESKDGTANIRSSKLSSTLSWKSSITKDLMKLSP